MATGHEAARERIVLEYDGYIIVERMGEAS